MHELGRRIASVLATMMMVACAASDDDEPPWGPSSATANDGASAPNDDDADTDDGDPTGDDGDGVDDGPVPPSGDDAGGSGDGGAPPADDDGGMPPPSDDGGMPPPDDDGGLPPGNPTAANCDAFCMTIDGCGWLAESGETFEDCALGCAEPLDMGACDAAWYALVGCLSALDCATLDAWFQTEEGGPECQAEAAAELQACGGV